ncbi:MAG: hypothetical protein FD160_4103 [Caulobacteraceae bacterium]|nr:MAG: hypothetical protein FD160_4103 [Caulobacteraceae bacterium]
MTSAPSLAVDPDVLLFLDYRAYLRALYEARKKHRGFSFRAFSRRAGLTSPNYLKLVIDGERNLSRAMALRFAHACGLSGARERHFTTLVAFNQARTLDERNQLYARLRRHRRAQDARRLGRAQDLYHSRWYLPAIREFVTSDDFREDPKWIARQLWPSITTREAAEALAQLAELGLLTRGEDGKLAQSEPTVSTGPELRSLHLGNFHRTMIDHAKGAIDAVPALERDISSLTLCLGASGLARVKQAIQRFRRELLDLAEMEDAPRQVVQVNFQLFPLTRLAPEPEARPT